MKALLSTLAALGLLLLCAAPVCAMPEPDDLLAEAAVLMDADTGQVLYGKNADRRMSPASITKIMTGLLAMEQLDSRDLVTASSVAVDTPAWGSSAYLQAGERLTVEQTMYAMMLRSANEAANVLAEAVAGSLDAFAGQMNTRAAELGAQGTHFSNAHGLPARNHYTTARDMALITRQALGTPGFLTYFGAGSYIMSPTNKFDGRVFTNTHRMLLENYAQYDASVIGGKTGYTVQAGYTLVTAARQNGRTLICVVLKSDSYYADTQALLAFGFGEFTPYTYVFDDASPVRISIRDGERETGALHFQPPRSAALLLHESLSPADIRVEYRYPESPTPEDPGEGSIVLHTGAGQEEPLPGVLLAIPLEAVVESYPPPSVETIRELPGRQRMPVGLRLLYWAPALMLVSGAACLGFVLSRRKKKKMLRHNRRRRELRYRSQNRGRYHIHTSR